MVVQEYILHLSNGDKVTAWEDYDAEGPETLVSMFGKSIKDPDKCVRIGDEFVGFDYIPWKNVTHLSTGNVYEFDDWVKKHGKREETKH